VLHASFGMFLRCIYNLMPNLATIIPAMDHIDKHLTTAAINNKYPLAIKAALAIGKKTLNCYYDKTDDSKVFRIAMGMYFLALTYS
jgi:hypothetical protein